MRDQIGLDLAKNASDRVSRVTLDALALCNTSEQARSVVLHVLGTVTAHAAKVISAELGLPIAKLTAAETFELMAKIMRNTPDTEGTLND